MGEENKDKLNLVDSLAVRYRPRQFSDIVGNVGNIKQIKGFLQKGQLPRTWLFSGNPGAGKCITGNSLVQTPDGLLDIETIVGNDFLDFKEKEIQIINGEGGVETTSHVYRALAQVTIKITTLRGNTLTGTPEHPIVVLGEQGKVWKPLKELTVADAPFVCTSVEHLCGLYDKITSIEVIKEPCFVYDLTLPETHSFIANGFINHNTTSARILAMTVNCENIAENIKKGNPEPCLKCRSCKLALEGKHPDVIEINCGSEDGGVQGMRDLVNSTKLAPRFNIKCFLMDEAQLLSLQAKNSILKPLEEPPSHVLWALCTTDPDKLPKATLTRCIKLFYEYPTILDCAKRLWRVAKQEYSESVASKLKPFMKKIAQNTNGQMRDSYSLLESLASIVEADKHVSEEELQKEFVAVLTSMGELSVPASRFITYSLMGRYTLPLGIINDLDQTRLNEFLTVLSRHTHYASLYFAHLKEGNLNELNKQKFYGINFVRFDNTLKEMFHKLSKKYSQEQIQYKIIALCGGVLDAINKNRQGLLTPEQSILCAINSYMRDMTQLTPTTEE